MKEINEQEQQEVNKIDLDKLSEIEIIQYCGKLKFPITKIITLLQKRITPDRKSELIIELRTPGSKAYEAYTLGATQAEFYLQNSLQSLATEGDKDALASLNEEQRKNAINRMLNDKFGIEIPE